jgi:hypothetical protein
MHILTSGHKKLSEDFFHVKNFENLLHDSINLLYAAYDVDRETDDHDIERAYSRGSMLSTLLLFECAANCCIDALHLDGQFANDVDKLPFLSKFELFLGRVSKTPFDRGCKIVQSVSELKSLRDKYVHPKVKKLVPVQIQPHHYSVEAEKTKQLGISHNPSAWRREIGLKSAQSANDFFNLYFTQWCGFDSNTVCSILMDTDAAEIPSRTSFGIDMIGGLDRAIFEFALDFAYLGKGA